MPNPRSFEEEEEEEEPYLEKNVYFLLSCTALYPTYRTCFREFRPPVFLRIGILDTD